MKLRNGFVSNSSSSSFIVRLDKPVEDYTYEEFMDICGITKSYENENCKDECGDTMPFTYGDCVDTLLNDLKDEYSKKLSDWFKEEYNIKTLGPTEYKVSYGSEDSDWKKGNYMEWEFMPHLKITKDTINMH